MADPVGSADLYRLLDRGQAVGLARMDGVVGVVAPQMGKRLQPTSRREPLLGTGDVESRDAVAAITKGKICNLPGRLEMTHGRDQLSDEDVRTSLSAGRHAFGESVAHGLDSLRRRQAGAR